MHPQLHTDSLAEGVSTAAAANLRAFLVEPLKQANTYHRLVDKPFEFITDDVATEERLRYHYGSNSILGLCGEHTQQRTTFNFQHDVEALRDRLLRGEIHLAKESMVVIAVPLSGDKSLAIPIVAVGTCKKGGGEDLNAVLLSVVEEEWRRAQRERDLPAACG